MNFLGRHSRLVLVAVALGGVSFLVVGAEIFLSVWEGDSIYEYSVVERRHVRLKEFHPGMRIVQYPRAQHLKEAHTLERRDYTIEADDNGFIVPSRVHESADHQIFFLGGSTTECFFVEEDKRFPYLVGRQLEDQLGETVNAFNSGVSGNNSLHSINILVNKIIPMDPAVVVLMHNANDLNILLYEATYWNQHKRRSALLTIREESGYEPRGLSRRAKEMTRTLLPHLHRRLALMKKKLTADPADTDEFAEIRGTTVAYDAALIEAQFRRNLLLFVSIVRTAGATPVLMTQATRFTDDPGPVVRLMVQKVIDLGIPYDDYDRLHERFNEVIREVGREADVAVIDLAREIPQEPVWMYDAMHFTRAGSERVAGVVSEHLLGILRKLAKP